MKLAVCQGEIDIKITVKVNYTCDKSYKENRRPWLITLKLRVGKK